MREGLEGKDAAKRARAERALAGVTDPRAVSTIWAVFISGGTERSQVAAVQMFGQIDGAASSLALATLAILDPQGTVRARAAETLMRRDPRDIVGRLISLVRKPFTYKVRPIDEPGSTGELFIEGETFNVRRLYRSRGIDPGLVPAAIRDVGGARAAGRCDRDGPRRRRAHGAADGRLRPHDVSGGASVRLGDFPAGHADRPAARRDPPG
jgi:hypothetical protein